MSSPPDLHERLMSASGPDPDADQALAGVMSRIHRRSLRRNVVAGVAAALVAVSVAAWLAGRLDADDATVVAGEPPATSDTAPPADSWTLNELWSADGVGTAGFAPSGGNLMTLLDGDVFVAEGFGGGPDEPAGRITALDRVSGELRWVVELGGPAFLQGASGTTVVANTQHERIVGLNAADGTIRWEVSLAAIGLDGYGAVTSAVTASVSAIGVSANFEGDTRSPVVLGVETATGTVLWMTPLVDGTDLMWGDPPTSDGQAVFTSTLSHPGSAEENVAHLVDLADGSIEWAVGMGGGQGFSEDAPIIDGAYVHLPAHPDVLSVDRADGTPRWTRSGHSAMPSAGGLWIIAPDGSLVMVDPATGEVIGEVSAPIAQATHLLDLTSDVVAVLSHTELAVINPQGEVLLSYEGPAALTDLARFDDGVVYVARADQSVTAYSLEPS
jgi:outer membrane protein assembly factor BamB